MSIEAVEAIVKVNKKTKNAAAVIIIGEMGVVKEVVTKMVEANIEVITVVVPVVGRNLQPLKLSGLRLKKSAVVVSCEQQCSVIFIPSNLLKEDSSLFQSKMVKKCQKPAILSPLKALYETTTKLLKGAKKLKNRRIWRFCSIFGHFRGKHTYEEGAEFHDKLY